MAVLPNPLLAGFALIVAGFGNAGFGIMQSTLIFRGVKPEMRALLDRYRSGNTRRTPATSSTRTGTP